MNIQASTSSMADKAVPGTSGMNSESQNPQASTSSSIAGCSKTLPVTQKNDEKEKTRKMYLMVYKFLQQQWKENGNLNDVQKESLEVIVNCLGYAFQFFEFDYLEHSLPKVYDFFDKYSKKKYVEDMDSDEGEVPPEDIVKADEFKEKGNKLMREDKFKEALEFYEKAVRINPREPALYCNRAAAYNHLNRYKEAVKDCNTALALNPSYAKAYVRRALAYEKLKDNKHALKSYKKAYKLEPENESYKNLYVDAGKRFKQRQDESTSTSTSSFNMFLGPGTSSLPFAQLPEFNNLMESIFNNPEGSWTFGGDSQDPNNRSNSRSSYLN